MSDWMYQLIRDKGKIKLCELYNLSYGYFYLPVSWTTLFKYPKMVILDLLSQKEYLGIIPEGKFLSEQITEIVGGYNE